jgi:hypothetical protein
MRFHPGLLALGLLLCAVLACSGGVNVNTTGNNANNSNSPANNANNSNGAGASTSDSSNASGVHIDKLYVAKDANGNYGDETTSFSPSDHTVYSVAKLNESSSGTKVKFVWYAEDVEGGKGSQKVQEIEYDTKALENTISAHLTLPQDWPKGKYKVEAYVNGKLDKTAEYTVE